MSFKIIPTPFFSRQLKRLAKKYFSLTDDLQLFNKELKENPMMGEPLGRNCYKIRVAIASKGKGKSGGARVISLVRVTKNTVFLLSIYDKSEDDTISENEINNLLKKME
jgi:mRNA-degrading endonuclease RelE of RelBE toxin-antitoxin system